MHQLLTSALAGDTDALQALAALVSIFAIVPASLIFIVSQWHQIGLLRNERHRQITEQYHSFLDKCLAFPRLRLGAYDPVPTERLTEDELYQRDTLFDMLTSLFETAFLSYANRVSSHRQRQWGGWDGYVDIYVGRADYRDWWLRIMFGGDPAWLAKDDSELRALNVSQYDVRFEQYMIAKLRRHDWKQPKPARRRRQTH